MTLSPPARRSRFIVLSLLVLAACGSSGAASGTPTPPLGTTPKAPTIVSFDADPTQIAEGDTSELTWEVSDPDAAVRLAPLRTAVTGNSQTVSPVLSTTYTLTVSNALGSDTASVTVNVLENGQVPGSSGNGSETDTTDEAADPYADAWVDAAGNLSGLESECGSLTLVTPNPNDGSMIAGVALHGLWSKAAGSAEWVALGSDPASDVIEHRPSSIIFDPVDPNVYWESGIYQGAGGFKTTDNGRTFTRLGNIVHSDLIAIDFSDPQRQTMLSGVHEQPKIFRSVDGGTTWVDISGGLPPNLGFASSPIVIDATTYLLGTSAGPASGVFRTVDGGFTWSPVYTSGVVGTPLTTGANGFIYWLLEGGEGMIVSANNGVTWTESTGVNGPRAALSTTVIALPGNRIAAVGGGHVVVSGDQGDTWTTVGPALPYEPNGIAYSAEEDAFYAWRFECNKDTPNLIRENSIIRLDPRSSTNEATASTDPTDSTDPDSTDPTGVDPDDSTVTDPTAAGSTTSTTQ